MAVQITDAPVGLAELAAASSDSEGEHVGAYDIEAAIIPQDKMCVRPADLNHLIANYQIRRVCGPMCDPGAGDYHDDFPTGRHYRRREGIG